LTGPKAKAAKAAVKKYIATDEKLLRVFLGVFARLTSYTENIENKV
jgi:hypothetical protein